MEDVDELSQSYCLHKHIVNKYNYKDSMSEERSLQNQLSREKKRG